MKLPRDLTGLDLAHFGKSRGEIETVLFSQ